MLLTELLKPGLRRSTLNLEKLYDKEGLKAFNEKWREFYKSDPDIPKVFKKRGKELEFLCDNLVPQKSDDRRPIFLLFGNSTPHSITEGVYFSYEGNRREHRMWKIFHEMEVLRFDFGVDAANLEKRNELRREALFSLNYKSPFRVGMDVFVSIPSTPSKQPWSGVAGVQKLLGAKAMRKLVKQEQARIKASIRDFMGNKGHIITFQKDAYNGIISESSPQYNLSQAIGGLLQGKCLFDETILVYGIAPTRYLNGGQAKKSLRLLINKLKCMH